MQKALGTLPWVEHASIQIDTSKREVRFDLSDKTAFNQDEVGKALKGQRFPKFTVKLAP